MNAVLCPVVTHEFEYLENLFEMQILLIGDNVQAFIKIVSFFAIYGGGKVTRGIQRSSVLCENKTGRHAVFFEIDHRRAFAYRKQTFFF